MYLQYLTIKSAEAENGDDNLGDNRQLWHTAPAWLNRRSCLRSNIVMAKAKPKARKPDKPYPGFPLTPHANGQWCKKIRAKVHFFGVWADPDAALDNCNRQAADLQTGRRPSPRATGEEITVRDLANAYLQNQEEKTKRKLMTPRWFENCERTVKAFTKFIGRDRPWDDLRPDNFAKYRMHLYDKYGVCAIDRAITVAGSGKSCHILSL